MASSFFYRLVHSLEHLAEVFEQHKVPPPVLRVNQHTFSDLFMGVRETGMKYGSFGTETRATVVSPTPFVEGDRGPALKRYPVLTLMGFRIECIEAEER